MTIRVLTALAAVALCLPACGSKDKPAAKNPTSDRIGAEGRGQSGDGTGEKTEPAQGELRDVLITLRRVHFSFDSDELTEDSRAALAEAGPKLARHPDVHLYVDGHADQRGTEEYNVALGERRAQVVADYLMRMGVVKEQLHIVSFGEGRPLVDQETDVAMAKNRRVDFRLMRGDIRLVVEEGPTLDDRGRPIENGATAQTPSEPNE
jgi:peptidoglycan-associated lipoprotein